MADLASPLLLQTCSSGKTIPRAKLEFMRADAQGERIKYFEIELENVLIGHITPEIVEGDILSEHVGLKFSKVKWKYTQKPGAAVFGNASISPGTAIATFVNGRYLSMAHGNHAALFLRPAAGGFWEMDQWKDRPGQRIRNISERFIRSLHLKQHKDGSWPSASDNADAYSIIEMN